MTAAEIAAALGGARREGSSWRCRCPVHGGRSLTMRDGRDTLLIRCWGGCVTRDVLAELRRLGLMAGGRDGTGPARVTIRSDGRADTARRIALAQQLWDAAQEAHRGPVMRYLTERGITIPIPQSLRYAPAMRRPEGSYGPAMVARIDDVDGRLIGLHRTWLARDPAGAWRRFDRASLGPIGGGAVRLAPAAETR
jgi:putative DNA primase/helicase